MSLGCSQRRSACRGRWAGVQCYGAPPDPSTADRGGAGGTPCRRAHRCPRRQRRSGVPASGQRHHHRPGPRPRARPRDEPVRRARRGRGRAERQPDRGLLLPGHHARHPLLGHHDAGAAVRRLPQHHRAGRSRAHPAQRGGRADARCRQSTADRRHQPVPPGTGRRGSEVAAADRIRLGECRRCRRAAGARRLPQLAGLCPALPRRRHLDRLPRQGRCDPRRRWSDDDQPGRSRAIHDGRRPARDAGVMGGGGGARTGDRGAHLRRVRDGPHRHPALRHLRHRPVPGVRRHAPLRQRRQRRLHRRPRGRQRHQLPGAALRRPDDLLPVLRVRRRLDGRRRAALPRRAGGPLRQRGVRRSVPELEPHGLGVQHRRHYGLARVTKIEVTARDGHGQWGGRVIAGYVTGVDGAGAWRSASRRRASGCRARWACRTTGSPSRRQWPPCRARRLPSVRLPPTPVRS